DFFLKNSIPRAVLESCDEVRSEVDNLLPEIKVIVSAVKHVNLPCRQPQLETDRRVATTARRDQEVVDPLAVHVPNDVEFGGGLVTNRMLLFPSRLGKEASMNSNI